MKQIRKVIIYKKLNEIVVKFDDGSELDMKYNSDDREYIENNNLDVSIIRRKVK